MLRNLKAQQCVPAFDDEDDLMRWGDSLHFFFMELSQQCIMIIIIMEEVGRLHFPSLEIFHLQHSNPTMAKLQPALMKIKRTVLFHSNTQIPPLQSIATTHAETNKIREA